MFKKIPFSTLSKEEQDLIIAEPILDKEKDIYIIKVINGDTIQLPRKGITKSLKAALQNLNQKIDFDSPGEAKKISIPEETKKENQLAIMDKEGIEKFNFIKDNFDILKEIIEDYSNKNTIKIIENKVDIPKFIFEIKDNKMIGFRMSESLKEELTEYAKENKIKVQDLINYITYSFLNNAKK